MKNRNIFTCILCLYLGLLVFLSCGKSSNNSNDEKVNLSIYQFKVETKDAFDSIIEKFENKNPNITVNIETVVGLINSVNSKMK